MRCLLNVPSVVLANLVLGENAFPEFLQEDCTPDKLAAALAPLLRDTPERRAQLAALARIPQQMLLEAHAQRLRRRDRARLCGARTPEGGREAAQDDDSRRFAPSATASCPTSQM